MSWPTETVRGRTTANVQSTSHTSSPGPKPLPPAASAYDHSMVTNNTNPNSADSDGEKIVVGIDGSTGAHAAIDWALSHAQANDQIEIIHTWTDPAMPAEIGMAFDPQIFADSAAAVLDAEIELIRERNSDIQIEGRCIRGHPGSALIEAAKDADLLVVGTRGHGGFVGLLLGSTSTYLAHHATCPLLIVPSDDRPAEEN